MKKLTFLQRTLMPLSLAFVLLITFIVGAFPKKEAIPVSADESNTVHYFSNSAPTYSYSTIARRYQYSEIDYVDTLDGLDRFNVWIETIDSVGDNDVIYIDFPWLSTMQTVQILEKVNGKCNQIYFISARELDEYPIEEDEDGNVYSMEEFFAQYSDAVEFYKTQKNEFYNFIVNSANEIVDLFENDISNSTFLFDASIIGSLKDSWREIRNTNAFANYAPAFYVFVKRIAQKAGIYAEDLEGFLREFAMREISIYVHCEENSFVKLSRFFEENYFLLDEIYEGFAVTMDIPDSKTEKCVAIASAPVDDIYRDFLVHSQLLYFGESDVDSRIVRPLVYLYVDIDIDQPELKYIDQNMLWEEIDEQPKDTLFDSISAKESAEELKRVFSDFVAEYNVQARVNWRAVRIEEEFGITVKENEEEKEAYFLDFDDNNGYAVMGEDYKLYDLQTSGESPFKGKTFDKCYYSVGGGYSYEVTANIFSSNDSDIAGDDSLYVYNEHYDGQAEDAVGCGDIDDPALYVKSKYDGEWTLGSNKSLTMQGYTQSRLSSYIHNKIVDDTIQPYSEGNCWFVSAYHVLQYLADEKWSNAPKSWEKWIAYDPAVNEPNAYSTFFNEKGEERTSLLQDDQGNTAYEWEFASSSGTMLFPELYTEVRKYTDQKYKLYKGGYIWQTSNIIENIADSYGHDVDTTSHFLWFFFTGKIVNKIDAGLPSIWLTATGTYGQHAMAVCGYRYYTQQRKILWFNHTDKKLFYELRDGHSAAAKFFDVSGFHGLAALIVIDCEED